MVKKDVLQHQGILFTNNVSMECSGNVVEYRVVDHMVTGKEYVHTLDTRRRIYIHCPCEPESSSVCCGCPGSKIECGQICGICYFLWHFLICALWVLVEFWVPWTPTNNLHLPI